MEDSDQNSGERIGSNDDLLTEILVRLPVTSILRFKSVCKQWRLLLSHKHFTHRYDNNFSKSPGLFGQTIYIRFDDENRSPHPFQYVPFDFEDRGPPPFRCLDFYFNRSGVIIRQSCNGLLLCSADHNGATEYYVFNPTTKQLAFIPSLPKNILTVALAFHQTHCVHYKVVCVRRLDPDSRLLQIQVYSSDTGKWKICIESFSVDSSEFNHPVYWNGAVHWWASGFHRDCDFLCYKLDVEQLQMLYVPNELMSDDDDDDDDDDDGEILTMYFGESRGHLHFMSRAKIKGSTLILNVYEMLRDRSGWFVKYQVQFDELLAFPNMFYQLGVIDVIRGKEEEETFLVLVTPGKVMRYNVHDKSFNQIYSQTDNDLYDETAICHRYIEALSSF